MFRFRSAAPVLSLAFAITGYPCGAGDAIPSLNSGATYLSAAELAAKIAHAASGTALQIPSNPGYKVLMIPRDATGDVEVHEDWDDIIVVEQGKGRFLVGGQVKGNHEISKGEWRGGEITGAREYNVGPGDLLLIPAGLPHRAVVTEGRFTYLAMKAPRQ